MSTSRRWANTSRTSFGSPVNTCHMATRLLWEQRSKFRGHTKDNKSVLFFCYRLLEHMTSAHKYMYTHVAVLGRNSIAFQMRYYVRVS